MTNYELKYGTLAHWSVNELAIEWCQQFSSPMPIAHVLSITSFFIGPLTHVCMYFKCASLTTGFLFG